MSVPFEASKCRTCLQECSQFHQLDEYMENNFKIVQMLDEIVPQIHIKIPSQFSHLVCGICVDKLLSGYKFQQLCIETNKRLCEMLGKALLTEMEDVVVPLVGVESVQMQQGLSDNAIFECGFNREEITLTPKSCNARKSDDEESDVFGGADGSDTDSSNEKLSILRDRKFNKTLDGSDPKIRPKKIRRKLSLPCTECGKVFDRLDSLKRHAAVHAKKRAFSCDICKYRFEVEKLYLAHMRIHEKETNDANDALVFTCTQKHTTSQNKGTKKKVKPKNVKCMKKEQRQLLDPNAVIVQETEISHHKENESELDKEHDSENMENEDAVYDNCSEIKSIVTEIEEIEKPNVSNRRSGYYPCEICGKAFDRPYRVKRHSSVHSLERTHACELCTYRFSTSNLLKIHMMQHESESGGNLSKQYPPDGFKCPDCPRSFEKYASLSAHRQIHSRSTSDANYTCTVCQSNFLSVRSLTEHITNKHPEVEKHKCDQCDKTFVLDDQLVEHLKRHKANKKNLVCPICDKVFGYTNTLKEHMRTHRNECSFLCPQCGKTFKTSSNLSQHMKRHFGLKKYQCPECPSRFNCRSDLIKHMSTHRNGKPHECDVCGSRFTRAYSLRKHKSLHTGEKPHKCNQCNMAFAINDHLRRHMRTHTGEKPYKCKYCERAYAESGDLNKHLRTHVGGNTYMCDQCPLAFKYNAELRQHVSEHYRMAHMQKMSEELQKLKKI